MKKRAETDHDVHDLVAERWSPRAFGPQAVAPELLDSLFEAARWAPSCFNEQPWRFVVASREDGEAFERLASCLVDANGWACEAPVLVLSIGRTTYSRNGKPNRHALHDVGLATENLALQAQALGLVIHAMAGFDTDAARERLEIPEPFEPVAMIAVGHPGDPDSLPPELAERERAPRTRRPLAELVFRGKFEGA